MWNFHTRKSIFYIDTLVTIIYVSTIQFRISLYFLYYIYSDDATSIIIKKFNYEKMNINIFNVFYYLVSWIMELKTKA